MDKQEKGRLGENAVCTELEKRGHKIIQRNFRKSFGEIDIISTFDRFIIFTEVKTRQTRSMVSGIEAVNYSKRKKIILTADFYLCNVFPGLMARPKLQPRYDIAEVTITRGDNPSILQLNILENAFTADGIYTLY